VNNQTVCTLDTSSVSLEDVRSLAGVQSPRKAFAVRCVSLSTVHITATMGSGEVKEHGTFEVVDATVDNLLMGDAVLAKVCKRYLRKELPEQAVIRVALPLSDVSGLGLLCEPCGKVSTIVAATVLQLMLG
jgi:hypothetical protein